MPPGPAAILDEQNETVMTLRQELRNEDTIDLGNHRRLAGKLTRLIRRWETPYFSSR
jgi:hypothetical protein